LGWFPLLFNTLVAYSFVRQVDMVKKVNSSAGQALNLLFQGNSRFLKRLNSVNDNGNDIIKPPKLVSEGQSPFCAILCCSDSCMPPEFIFDQGIGDLFVICTIGNYASTPAIASIEYAVLKLKVPLIVVLGHSNCEAIQATLDRELTGIKPLSENLNIVADELSPSVRGAIEKNQTEERKGNLVNYAARLHIQHANHCILKSPVLQEAQWENEIGIIGAYCSLDTGKVDFI